MVFHVKGLKPLWGSVQLAAAGGVAVIVMHAEPLRIAIAQPIPPAIQADPASSQSGYTACQPPSRDQYLLLVVSPTSENQNQIRRSLPATATSTVCSYQGNIVTRISGFSSVDSADAWAKYLNELTGLSTFIVRSPTQSNTSASLPGTPQAPTAAVETLDSGSRSTPTFNPRPLGGGYAVLVDYFSRPELAAQVQQALGKEIGLVSYRQRPYLLAVYTTEQGVANTTLKALSDRGFWAMVVDARRVTLLKQPINLSPLAGS